MPINGPVMRRTSGHRRDGRCPHCETAFETGEGCTTATIPFPDGRCAAAIRYGDEADEHAPSAPNCPDCGVFRGHYHHPFCTIERCPRCHGRLATCRCLDSGVTIHRRATRTDRHRRRETVGPTGRRADD